MMSPGEEKAWEILRGLDPAGVCRSAQVAFDRASGLYHIRSFGMDVSVDPGMKRIVSDAAEASLLLDKLGYFSRLSILWYLTGAKDIPLSGRLVQPSHLRGGQIFFRGTHILPLDELASRYGRDTEGFLKRGEQLGGIRHSHGDASIELFPFPRVPAVLILWTEDEEFPARADLLFDSTCEYHLALDVLWSTAMKTILIMM
jgi:hypothetical protein